MYTSHNIQNERRDSTQHSEAERMIAVDQFDSWVWEFQCAMLRYWKGYWCGVPEEDRMGYWDTHDDGCNWHSCWLAEGRDEIPF